MNSLSTELCGLKLKNPLILASGVLGSSASSLSSIAEHAGAVVTKSVSIEGKEGYKNPTVINWRCGLINAIGLAAPPAEIFAEELKKYRGDAPLIVSLYGYTVNDFTKLIDVFDFADAYELNLSCPHVSKTGFELGSDHNLAAKIVRALKDQTDKPVIAKISAMHDYIRLSEKLVDAGIDALTISNTLRGMKIDIVSRKPILSNVSGGVSGPAIKPIALKCVYDLYEVVDVPIVGCGGITTFEDVLEFIFAGATAVQVGSAAFFSSRIFYSLKESLIAYTRAHSCRLADLIGAAHSSTG